MNKRDMKYIGKALLLLVLLLVVDRGLGYGLKWMYFNQKGEDFYYTTKALDEQTADLVVLGSSRARNHYNPDILQDSLGMSCYNAGRSGCFLMYQRAQLDLILDRYIPKVIILEVTPYDMTIGEGDYDRLSGLLPYQHHTSWQEVITLKGPWEKYKCCSAIYPYNSKFFKMVKNLKDRGEFHANGFQPLKGLVKEDKKGYTNNIAIDKRKVEAMEHIIEVCKAKQIVLTMVTSPMYADVVETKSLVITDSLCKQNNIPYYSFLNRTDYDNKQLFHTIDHLNAMGADKFSSEIAHLLKE